MTFGAVLSKHLSANTVSLQQDNATAQLNNDMALALREAVRQNRINLLVSEFDAEEILAGFRGYNSLTQQEKVELQLPYIHTTLLINELINLQTETKGVNVKVKEKSGMRKDRFSSLEYNWWVCLQLEQALRKRIVNEESGSANFFMARPAKTYN